MVGEGVAAADLTPDAFLHRVEQTLEAEARTVDPEKARERAHFMKVVMPMHGLTVPNIRKLSKRGFGLKSAPFAEQWPLWVHVWWNARSHEAKLLPVLYLEGASDRPAPEALWPEVAPLAAGINCWDHSDGLSRFYSGALEADPDTVLPVLRDWNSDANPWLRRQSLVSLFFYSRFRATPPALDTVLPLVEARLDDEDYYVQKGVGWCLRECFNVYPDETYGFLQRHAAGIAPAAWQAATEKLTAEQKASLKALRGRIRKA